MSGFYDDEKEKIDRVGNQKSNLSEDISVKWKEAFSQIDYGLDIEASTIYMFGDIGDGTLYDFILRVRAVLYMRDDEKKNDPINIIINSDGGDVYEALGMIDYIQSLDIKVNTIYFK